MRFSLLVLALTTIPAAALSKPLPAGYGYGRAKAEQGAVLDLRGLLPPGPEAGPVLPAGRRPAQTEPALAGPSAGAMPAECYDPDHTGLTQAGEAYDPTGLSAAHPDLPLSTLALLREVRTGKEVIVRVNDRSAGRSIMLSPAAAAALGAGETCRSQVSIRPLGAAPARSPGGRPYREQGSGASPRPSAATVPGDYLVQIGAFSLRENADAAMARAGAAGPVLVEPVTVSGATLYRVRLGPWRSRDEAEQARAAAEALGFAGAKLSTR